MWVCPKCGRSFRRKEQDHYCGKAPETIDVLFFDGERSVVEGGVGEVDVVLLGHAVLGQAQAFAELWKRSPTD